jgi:hypothetical protein
MTNEELTPTKLALALDRLGDGSAEAHDLAVRVREWFGREELKNGPDPMVDELTVAWALEAPGDDARVRVLEYRSTMVDRLIG